MTSTDLLGLIGSRICHDIISPLGAIGNGVELLELSGTATGAEMALVSDSVDNATAKVRFFRLAFGAAEAGQMVPYQEILPILDALSSGGRHRFCWKLTEACPRAEVRPALLAMLCLESALPLGGDIVIKKMGAEWLVSARHDRLTLNSALWRPLVDGQAPEDVSSATVHFALLPAMAAEAGRRITVESGPAWAMIRF